MYSWRNFDDVICQFGVEKNIAPNENYDGHDSVVVNAEELSLRMAVMIGDFCEATGLASTDCVVLLQSANWDKQRAFENFFASDACHQFYDMMDFNEDGNVCGICRSETKDLRGFEKCGHMACFDCWSKYLHKKITEDKTIEIKCIDDSCMLQLDHRHIIECAKVDGQLMKQYNHLQRAKYVEANPELHPCPMPYCGNVVMLTKIGSVMAKCSCRTRFCAHCHEDWHEPLSCDQLKWWNAFVDEGKTMLWMKAHKKHCPECATPIENYGCDDMHCAVCDYKFCWSCLRGLDNHERCMGESSTGSSDAAAVLKEGLDRYTAYTNNFDRECELAALINEQIDNSKGSGLLLVEAKHLHKAVDVLSRCWHTLAYTFAFLNLPENSNNDNKHLLLDFIHKDLDKAASDLAVSLEQLVSTSNAMLCMQQVKDKCLLAENRLRAVLSFCKEVQLEH